MQRLISAILSFIISIFSMFGVDIPPEMIGGTEKSTVSTEAAIPVPSLPEDLVMYCEEVFEEDISVLPDSGMQYAARDLLVQMESEVTEEEARALAREYGADLAGLINLTGTCQWRFPGKPGRDMLLAVQEEVEALPGIACVSLNYIFDGEGQGGTPLSDSVPQETASKKADKLWGFTKSHGEFAWEHQDWMKEPVSVAVLDMGFQNHNKLQYKLLHSGAEEDKVHGTHVMGIIGATRKKKKEVCGIYPKASGRMYAYDISNSSSMIEHVVELVDAVTREIKVLNISIGYSKEMGFYLHSAEETDAKLIEVAQQTRLYEKVLEQLIDEGYEFLLVIAAGNESSRKEHWNASTFFTSDGKVKELSLEEEGKLKKGTAPETMGLCAYQVMPPEVSHPALRISNEKVAKRIVCVSAYNKKNKMLGMANMGERVDILAPGSNIYSTCNYTKKGLFEKQKTEGALSGTSMAAPYVSGALACIWSMNSSLSAETVRNILMLSCDTSIQDSASPYSGLVLNVENAMKTMNAYLHADTEQSFWKLMEWLIGDDEHRTEAGEPEEDVRKVPVKMVVKDGVSNVEIEKFEVEVKNGQGEVKRFTQDWTNEDKERSDFEQRMENSVFYLEPGEYTVRVYAQGYEVLPHDEEAVENGGLQTWEFYLQPEQEITKNALQNYLEEEILGRYPVLSTETLYGSGASGWTENDLNGVLSADIQDYDWDGQPELLIVRVETSRQETDGASLDVWHFRLHSSFYLEMYEGYSLEKTGISEALPMQVSLRDTKELPVYIGYLPWGVPLLQTGLFSYERNRKTYLAVDRNLHHSDEVTTLDLFSYNGEKFTFEHAFGYQEHRQGNVYVKEALQEPQSLRNYDMTENAGWEILQEYKIAEHNYEPLSRENEWPLMAEYQNALKKYGLFSKDTRLRVNQEIPADDRYYTATTPDIYTAETEIRFLSGIYTIYRRNQPTELWRKDYQGSLDAWR